MIVKKSTLVTLLLVVAFALLTHSYRKFVFSGYLSAQAGSQLQTAGGAQSFAILAFFTSLLIFLVVALLFNQISSVRLLSGLVLWAPLTVFISLSLLWVDDPAVALPRTIQFFATLFISIVICSDARLIRFFYRAFLIFAIGTSVIGLVFYLTGSRWGFFSNGYGSMFTGVFTHKGVLSEVSALGVILALAWFDTARARLLNVWVIMVPAITLLLAATLSSTGGVLAGWQLQRRFRVILWSTGILMLLLPLIFYVFSSFFVLLGKDPTLTGRTILWALSLEQSRDSLVLGHGFVHLSNTAEWAAMLDTQFRNDSFFIPHAHNLWVETIYKFGLVGTVILFTTLIIMPGMVKTLNNDFSTRASCGILIFYALQSGLTVPFLISGFSNVMFAIAATNLVAASAQTTANSKKVEMKNGRKGRPI